MADPVPALPSVVDLRCCDVREMLADAGAADLVIADPPWAEYDQRPGVAAPDESYTLRSLDEIAGDLLAARKTVGDVRGSDEPARLLLWGCWPLLNEAIEVMRRGEWDYVTGGAWQKLGQQGVGYHWLGRSEFALVGRSWNGACHTDRSADLGNAHASEPGAHSAKPEDWHAAMIRRWVPPGGLVVDLYAGLGGVARAVLAAGEGRRYLGAEVDPKRHAIAVGLTAQRRAE